MGSIRGKYLNTASKSHARSLYEVVIAPECSGRHKSCIVHTSSAGDRALREGVVQTSGDENGREHR